MYFINRTQRALYDSVKHYSNRVGAIHPCALCKCHMLMFVFHQSNPLAPLSLYFSVNATYLVSSLFMYLCVPSYCHICLCLLPYAWELRCYTKQTH